MGNKIFIDAGANIGQSVQNFINKWSDWKEYEIHSFEPRPDLEPHFDRFKPNDKFTYHNEAVWVDDSGVEFYLSQTQNFGSSILAEKKSGGMSKAPIKVPSVDISTWIQENFHPDDYIVLKMDIEGAEYSVVRKMLDDDTFKYIDKLYIEFHYEKVGRTKEEAKVLMDELKEYDTEVLMEVNHGLNFI